PTFQPMAEVITFGLSMLTEITIINSRSATARAIQVSHPTTVGLFTLRARKPGAPCGRFPLREVNRCNLRSPEARYGQSYHPTAATSRAFTEPTKQTVVILLFFASP